MKNIHLIPTDKTSMLWESKHGRLYYNQANFNDPDECKNLNIYITNSEEIKEGDWCIDKVNTVYKQETDKVFTEFTSSKKIILSTDSDLIKDGVQAIDGEFLEWFVENPSCEEVEIVFETLWLNKRFGGVWQPFPDEFATERKKDYKIIIPSEESKQETIEKAAENYVKSKWGSVCYPDIEESFQQGAKFQQKRSYSEEEVWKLLNKLNETLNIGSELTLEQWFEQFKKSK